MSKKYIIGVSSVVAVIVIALVITATVRNGKNDKEASDVLDSKITVIRNIDETSPVVGDIVNADDSDADELDIMPADGEAAIDLPATNTTKSTKQDSQSKPATPATPTVPAIPSTPTVQTNQVNSSGTNSSSAGTTNNANAAPQQETNTGGSNSNTSGSTTAPIIDNKNEDEDVPSSPSESYDASNGKVYETPRIPVR